MTLEQAIENVTKALRSLSANADVHDALKQCMQVIVEATKPKME